MNKLHNQLPLLWLVDKLDCICSTHALRLIARVHDKVNAIFEHMIKPTLLGGGGIHHGAFLQGGCHAERFVLLCLLDLVLMRTQFVGRRWHGERQAHD
jgi:hypothetical protein